MDITDSVLKVCLKNDFEKLKDYAENRDYIKMMFYINFKKLFRKCITSFPDNQIDYKIIEFIYEKIKDKDDKDDKDLFNALFLNKELEERKKILTSPNK